MEENRNFGNFKEISEISKLSVIDKSNIFIHTGPNEGKNVEISVISEISVIDNNNDRYRYQTQGGRRKWKFL